MNSNGGTPPAANRAGPVHVTTALPPCCRRCGEPYPWRGGISFAAVAELGRLAREHYEAAHPGIEVNR